MIEEKLLAVIKTHPKVRISHWSCKFIRYLTFTPLFKSLSKVEVLYFSGASSVTCTRIQFLKWKLEERTSVRWRGSTLESQSIEPSRNYSRVDGRRMRRRNNFQFLCPFDETPLYHLGKFIRRKNKSRQEVIWFPKCKEELVRVRWHVTQKELFYANTEYLSTKKLLIHNFFKK